MFLEDDFLFKPFDLPFNFIQDSLGQRGININYFIHSELCVFLLEFALGTPTLKNLPHDNLKFSRVICFYLPNLSFCPHFFLRCT